jgi:transcriptional regulator GlxA family with amidase domain
MHAAILTFDGFNEIDSLVAFHLLNRVKRPSWRVSICAPTPTVTSMNGLTIAAQTTLEDATNADVVLVGSGRRTRELVVDDALMARMQLDPTRQLIGSQCSGALMLAKLGLLRDIPACTDVMSKPWVLEAGVEVVNQPFYAKNNVATAGGCLASQYLATWVITKLVDEQTARDVLSYVAPVGERDAFVERAMRAVGPYLSG